MTALLAWIKKACPRGRRKVESEYEAGSDQANTVDLEDIAEQLEKASEAATNALSGWNPATDGRAGSRRGSP